MSEKTMKQDHTAGLTRRDFMKTTAALSLAATMGNVATAAGMAHPGGSDKIRIGLIGCGGRGTQAACDCVKSAPGVELVAMGDLVRDRLESSRKRLAQELGTAFKVKDDHCFTGFDNYKQVIDSGVDLVLMATPPGFRPIHMRAAIEAGKHIFAEKPVAVDPIGARSVMETAALAKTKGLAIVAGTLARHAPSFIETIERVHQGAIGDIVGGQIYYLTGALWVKERTPEMSEMEWQCRNWLYFDWLSGDHIVEQHVHNIDRMNWVMGGPPLKAMGFGGRQQRTEAKYGNIYDHFCVEYEYPSGVRINSMCSQMKDTTNGRIGEHILGTKGTADLSGQIEGANPYQYQYASGDSVKNAYVQEHADLIRSIREGKPLNEGYQIAESTLTAILGRMAVYTGRAINYKWVLESSKLDLVPTEFAFGPHPVNPVPIPGLTKLV